MAKFDAVIMPCQLWPVSFVCIKEGRVPSPCLSRLHYLNYNYRNEIGSLGRFDCDPQAGSVLAKVIAHRLNDPRVVCLYVEIDNVMLNSLLITNVSFILLNFKPW